MELKGDTKKYKQLAVYALRLAIGFACLVMASAIAGSISYVRPGPGFDFWGAGMPFLKAAVDGPWSWSMLWEMSAGAHRLVVSRVLFFVEWWVDDFRNGFLLASAWFALAGSAAVVLRLVWKDKYLDSYSRSLCLFLVLMGFGSAQHMNNLAYVFNLQWSFGLLFSFLFIDGVIRAIAAIDSKKKTGFAIQAGLAALALTFTTFSLPVVLCTWIFLAWGLRIRRCVSIPVTIVLFALTAAYIFYLPLLNDVQKAMQSGASQESHTIFWPVLAYLGFFLVRYLASPASELLLTPDIVSGVSEALVFMVAMIFITVLWRERIEKRQQFIMRPLLWFGLAFSVFVVFMALSTAMGRLTDAGAAISPRFRTFVLPFLTLSAIAFVCRVQQWRSGYRAIASVFLCLVTGIIVLPGHFRLLQMFSDEYDNYVTPVVAMSVGLTDKNVVHEARMSLWWSEDSKHLMEYRDFLRDHQKGIYASAYFLQLGKKIELPSAVSTSIPTATDMTGDITALPGGGYQWKGVTDQCGDDGRVALVNNDGLVVGAGLVRRVLVDASWKNIYRVFMPLCQTGNNVGWTAFLPLNIGHGDQVRAVVFDSNTVKTIATIAVP